MIVLNLRLIALRGWALAVATRESVLWSSDVLCCSLMTCLNLRRKKYCRTTIITIETNVYLISASLITKHHMGLYVPKTQ